MTRREALAAVRTAAELEPTARVVPGAEVYRVQVTAPGLAEDDFRVEVADRILRVSGPHLPKARPDATFEFRFRLPDEVDGAGIEARLERGVLVVRAPKAPGPPRAVEVGRA